MTPTYKTLPFKQGYMLTVDPGLRHCGLAMWSPIGILLRAGLSANPVTKDRGPAAWQGVAEAVRLKVRKWSVAEPSLVLIERQVVQAGRTRNPADILELAGAAGAIAGLYSFEGKVSGYFDREWKGTIQGDAMTEMIKRRVAESPEELQRIVQCPEYLLHNVYDAIGIGLFYFGRLTPRRVIAR